LAKLLLSIDVLYVPIQLACLKIDIQVIITSQLATKLLTLENKPANFDTGDRAVLMPQLGITFSITRQVRSADLFRRLMDDRQDSPARLV